MKFLTIQEFNRTLHTSNQHEQAQLMGALRTLTWLEQPQEQLTAQCPPWYAGGTAAASQEERVALSPWYAAELRPVHKTG